MLAGGEEHEGRQKNGVANADPWHHRYKRGRVGGRNSMLFALLEDFFGQKIRPTWAENESNTALKFQTKIIPTNCSS